MNYDQLAYLHLATITPAFLIGTLLMLRRKGTRSHKSLGRLYMLLMLATAIITLFMSAGVGPSLADHFGFIHSFSLLTLVLVPAAYLAARNANLRRHKYCMIGLYVGGIIIAGGFAFMPGRMVHQWLFS